MRSSVERSALFGLALLGRGTGTVESARSYLQRLAFAHHVKPTRLLDHLLRLFPLVSGGTGLREKVSDLHISGTGPAVENIKDRLERATRQDLGPAFMQRFANVLSAQRLMRRGKGVYCPECVKEAAPDGLPYGRLLWEVQVVTVCPTHRVRLRDSSICGTPERVLRLNRRPSLTGVCRACGSVGYRCCTGPSEVAPAEELWIAEQVAKLIALSDDEVSRLRPELTREGIRQTVQHSFGGSSVNAALSSQLARATVHTWLDSSLLPSLDCLLKLCWSGNADLVALLRGRYSPLQHAQDVKACALMKRGYRRRQIDWTEVRAALVREARSESPRTVAAVAAGFGVTPRQMRQKLPTELNALGDRVRALREQRLIALYAETEARYQAAADALLREGLTVSTKSLQRRSGQKVFASRNNVRARALRAVADRFAQLTAP